MDHSLEGWLKKVLGNNKKSGSIVEFFIEEKGYEEKVECPAPVPSIAVANNGPVGAQVIGGGNIAIENFTQNVTTTTTVLKSKKEIESAKQALGRRQESACLDLGNYIFLGVDFLEQMQRACEATVSFCLKKGPNCENEIFGTGFVVDDGRFVMTCMHNITLDGRRSYKQEVSDWKSASPSDWSDLGAYGTNFVDKCFIIAGYRSGEVTEGKFKKLAFSAENIILLPHQDVALIKIDNARELNLPSVCIDKNLQLKTGETAVEARCFVVGHPKLVGRPIDDKVVSMQHHNFLRCVQGPFVQYFTDTERGFSGGPVFVWDQRRLLAVAVHHTGQRLREEDHDETMMRNNLVGYNEGTLISAVLGSPEVAENIE